MTATNSTKLYRLQVGNRVFEDITAGVIVKNIRNGKLRREHLVARAGSDNWFTLGQVAELAPFFEQAGQPVRKAEQVYDIQRRGQTTTGLPRTKVAELIRRGELSETDRIRISPNGAWGMAGDREELQRYFDMRRKLVAERGAGMLRPEDTGTPFYLDLAGPFIYIGNLRFVFNIVAILVCYAIALFVPIPLVSGPITILANFYLFAYYFRVISDAGAGGRKFPDFTESSDLLGEMVRPGIQFFLTRFAAVLPLTVYIFFIKFGELEFFWKIPYLQIILTMPYVILFAPDFTTGTFLFADPIIWVLLIFVPLYMPIALMRQASYGEFLPTFNLPAVFISIVRAFGPYMALIFYSLTIDIIGGIIMVIVFIWMGLAMMAGPAGGAMALFPIPFALLLQAIIMTGMFLKMYLTGRFLFQNTERMGWH